jgi:hypothetical protein
MYPFLYPSVKHSRNRKKYANDVLSAQTWRACHLPLLVSGSFVEPEIVGILNRIT